MAKKKGRSKQPKQRPTVNTASINNTINEEVIAAALNSVNPPVLLKMCRLCETKDGPFLNIFDPDNVTAKKIQDLMPFSILENDDLPHRICFRCSAKVEELHEFVEKCVRTQESLQAAIGKNKTVPKTKTRTEWEEKLNKSNMSNDDICNALIKKAMEGIKDIPINSMPCNETKPSSSKVTPLKTKSSVDTSAVGKKEVPIDSKLNQNTESDVLLKKIKLSVEKCDSKPAVIRGLRSKNSDLLETELEKTSTVCDKKDTDDIIKNIQNEEEKAVSKISKPKPENSDKNLKVIESSEASLIQKGKESNVTKATSFNIMDYITTIKVNGVGILFQCRLCNRNFLKKEVVEVHGCAKNGPAKIDIPKTLPLPEPPKALNSVKYIDSKRSSAANKSTVMKLGSDGSTEVSLNSIKNVDVVRKPDSKPKPKIGPASKMKRDNIQTQIIPKQGIEIQGAIPTPKITSEANTSTSNTVVPTVNFPSIPSLNSRYKLVPGPNNSFTLIEEPGFTKNGVADEITIKKRVSHLKPGHGELNKSKNNVSLPVVIDLDDDNDKPSSSKQQPYPVGLFQTRSHHSSKYVPPVNPETPVFTTPAMKKQSYTVVQTGNPSKLVISTKQVPVEEIPKKRSKKTKTDASDGAVKEPFSVTLEDVGPPNKDSGFFTFINVDPLLQPSYVLPTHSIIQESQISTSTPAITNNRQTKETDKYSCSICALTFSREKKLLTHIHSHYTKMDEEDDLIEERNQNKKRKRKAS